jgi:Dolichyl-phosphate-mannose-protein mannosyltransferase
MHYPPIKSYPNLFFFVCCVLSAGFIGFHHVINLAPQSIHYWRQADCTSQTLNFFKDGMDFFSPRIHNCGWTLDAHTAGEFPILYYFTASLYHIFGQQEWILRGVDLLIYFVGLWALFRLALHLIENILISICFSLLFLASPMLAFYGVNYLPNVPALSLVFLSWLFFYNYVKTQRLIWFYACNGALLFAGLIKPTTLITWVAIGAIWLFEVLRMIIFKKKSVVFPNFLTVIPAFLMVFIPFVSWRMWADNYNKIHDTGYYFLKTVMPIWDMTLAERENTLRHIEKYALNTWFALPSLWVIVGITVLNIIFVRKQNPLLFALFSLILVGTVFYFLAFFRQFMVHDYYATDLFGFGAISILLFLFFLKTHLPTLIEKPVFQVLFTAFLIFNLNYTRQDFAARYDMTNPKYSTSNDFPLAHFDIKKVRHFINQSTPITEKDTIVSLPDITPNATLYYYDRRGYSYWNFGPTTIWSKDWMRLMVQNHKCKYLIINDLKSPVMDSIRPFLKQPIAQLDSTIWVYDLKKVVNPMQ